MDSSWSLEDFCDVGRPCPNFQRLISLSDSEEEKPQLVIRHQGPGVLCRKSSSMSELHQHCPEALFQATIVKVNPLTGRPVACPQTYHRSLNSHFVPPHKNLQRRPKTMDFRMDVQLTRLEACRTVEPIQITRENDTKMIPLKEDLIKAWEKLHEREQEVEEMAMQWRSNYIDFLKDIVQTEMEGSPEKERFVVLYRRPKNTKKVPMGFELTKGCQKLVKDEEKLEVDEPEVEEHCVKRRVHTSDLMVDVMLTQLEAFRVLDIDNKSPKKGKKMSREEELSEEVQELEEEGEKLGMDEQKLEERTLQRRPKEMDFQVLARRPKNAMTMSMEEELLQEGQKLEEEGEKLELEEEKAEEKVEEKMGEKEVKKQAEELQVPKVISHSQSFDKATSMSTFAIQTNPTPIFLDKATSISTMCLLPEKLSQEDVPRHSTPAPGGQRIKEEVIVTQYGLSVGQLAKKVQILKSEEAGEPIPQPEPAELLTSLPWSTTDSDQDEHRVGDSLSSSEPLSPTPPSNDSGYSCSNESDYTRKPGEYLKKQYPKQVEQVSAKKKVPMNISPGHSHDSQDPELCSETTLTEALARSHKEFERIARESMKEPNPSVSKPKRLQSAGDSAK